MTLLATLDSGSLTALGFLALGLYCVGWIVYTRLFHPLAKVPGPWLASISRGWYMWQVHRGDMEKTQRRLHQKYGPLLRIAPNEITCADPAALKKIYPTQRALDKTDFYPLWNGLSQHRNLFAMTNDKAHGEARRVVNHVYSLSNVLKSEVYIDKCSKLFITRLTEHSERAEPVIDLGLWVQMYAFDVVGELFYSSMFGFMEKSHDHGGWLEAIDRIFPFFGMSAVSPRLMRFLILGTSTIIPSTRKALDALETICVSSRECVAKRLEQQKSTSTASERTDIMQQMFDIYQEKGSKVQFGIGEIEQEAYTALLAGSDTTGNVFRTIFYQLMKNPDVYEALQQEIDEAYREGRMSEPVRFAEALKLPLLCAVVKEAMRIHPAVQLSMGRIVPSEGMELCGKFIAGGSWVGMNGAVIQFDTSIFGADADRFRPTRWLEPGAANMDKHMLAFGAGTRTCIGKNISLAELHKLTPQVLRHFDLELTDKDRAWKTTNTWICKQDIGLVRLTKRSVSSGVRQGEV